MWLYIHVIQSKSDHELMLSCITELPYSHGLVSRCCGFEYLKLTESDNMNDLYYYYYYCYYITIIISYVFRLMADNLFR